MNVPSTWRKCNNKRLNEIFDEIWEEASNVCYDISYARYYISKPQLYLAKSVTLYGKCRVDCDDKNICYIMINERYVDHAENSRNTIIHELAHAIAPLYEHHGSRWKYIGDSIGKKWGIVVDRLGDGVEDGFSPRTTEDGKSLSKPRKYGVECPQCHSSWHRSKRTNLIKYPNLYYCPTCNRSLVALEEGE